MSLQPVRFIHSGDWHLETPLGGVSPVPPELREPFVDAPYLAAERVVQAALDHRVDFLILAGNTLPLQRACPYSFEFLLRQFQLLAEQNIQVYWLGTVSDDIETWPEPLTLPSNVQRFASGTMQQFEHQRDDKVVARLLGQSHRSEGSWNPADFAGGGDPLPRIAVASGKVHKRTLENKGIDYWALGGESRHHVILNGNSTAVYAGSPQGRQPQDTDAHGAVLVELHFGKATTQLIETDLWRWRRERVQATELTTVDQLQAQLTRQLNEIPIDASRFSWLLLWSVVCQGPLAWQMQDPGVLRRLLDALQQLTANDSRWTMRIETEPADIPLEWHEEDTVLGDFLRTVQRCEQNAEAWQSLAAFLPEQAERDALLRELQNVSEEDRQRLWRRVAAWGADLLRGEVDLEATSVVSG